MITTTKGIFSEWEKKKKHIQEAQKASSLNIKDGDFVQWYVMTCVSLFGAEIESLENERKQNTTMMFCYTLLIGLPFVLMPGNNY